MRKTFNINKQWIFFKKDIGQSYPNTDTGLNIDLPHTWNGQDGQDGGNDYYRGRCWYFHNFEKDDFQLLKHTFLEFKGVFSTAEVFLNGIPIGKHEGGYSTFRFEITDYLLKENVLVVSVDNRPNDRTYPQTADFTFYGGIYRDVNMITVNENHFDLLDKGSSGIRAVTHVQGSDGKIDLHALVIGNGTVKAFLYDGDNQLVASGTSQETVIVNQVHLWNGIQDPFLYKLKVQLVSEGGVDDELEFPIGFRSFHIDPEQGFFLNGEHYPLRGVCRHQDRPEIGNALAPYHHEEDIQIIKELGANTIRLAHYQHDDHFYDLCDKYGFIVWAEIPYISRHMNKAYNNAESQMQELILQQFNHPSIAVWGISNEITIHSADSDRLRTHEKLNSLCHQMDSSRMTAIAVYMPCLIYNKLNAIPDIVSYNLYFGWYFPFVGLAGIKLDRYHHKYPSRILGLAEYGAEGMPNLHSKHPRRGDNTEEYQTIYHEKMIRLINKRRYLWATHVWNMFDFAADARNQGGEPGMNHKGLVTFDRRTKKDTFFLYKAFWSTEGFVHISGKRFVNRTGKKTHIKVFSNQPEVELYNNGQLIGKVFADKVFHFDVPLGLENHIVAKSGEFADESIFFRVNEKDKSYSLKSTSQTKSWEK